MKKTNSLKLVSVNIPTYNSEKTLKRTLESVKYQDYPNVEIILIDSFSKDKTLEIARDFGCKVINYEGTLLGARGEGVKHSKGDFILLLDSDQILEKTAISRATALMKKFDMVWFYERSYNPRTILDFLYDADRQLIQKHSEDFIEPVGGVILPRFYKKSILTKAFSKIPQKILPICVAHDHAIIYYEAKKISVNVGRLDHAVWHIEPQGWRNLFKKTYRYGITTKKLVDNKAYPQIILSKNKLRKFYFSDLRLSLESNLLRIARGIPYKLGYYFGK